MKALRPFTLFCLLLTGLFLSGLAQAQMSIELPDGFAVPIMSDQPISISAQVLDHNGVKPAVEIRQRLARDLVFIAVGQRVHDAA